MIRRLHYFNQDHSGDPVFELSSRPVALGCILSDFKSGLASGKQWPATLKMVTRMSGASLAKVVVFVLGETSRKKKVMQVTK